MLERLEKTTVLVTGGTGFIGRHLLERLKKIPQIKIVSVSRSPQPASWSTPHIWIQSPLQNLTATFLAEKGIKAFDYVFHLAAFTPKSSSLSNDIEGNFFDNVQATRVLVENLPNKPKRFLFASTLDVYSPPENGRVLDEVSPVGPPTFYGASKIYCEYFLRAIREKNGLPFTVLRYGHIYGPGEETYGKLLPQSIGALKNGRPLTAFGSGRALRDYLYVDDAVYATLILAVSEAAEGETFNVVSGHSLPIRTILETLCRAGNFKHQINFDKTKPEGVSFSFDNKKLLSVLGQWNPLSLEEGLKRELAEWREK